jgi:hypothetical protein
MRIAARPGNTARSPDECYKLGELDQDDLPDIAIEVSRFVRRDESQTQLADAYQATLRD